MPKKRIGILTGGGDVPGLNTVIKTVTYRSSEDDVEVIGLRRGWEGLTHLNCDDPASRQRLYHAIGSWEHPHDRSTGRDGAALEPHQSSQGAEVA